MANSRKSSGEKRRGSFAFVMLMYALIMLMLIIIGLSGFYMFISAYEDSRPANTVSAFISSLHEKDTAELIGESLDGIEYRVQTDEEISECIKELVAGCEAKRSSTKSTDENPVYMLSCNGITFGQITLRQTEEKSFGFAPWEVCDTTFSFDEIFHSGEVTVPNNYTVSFKGRTLGEANITEKDIHYDFLEEFYEMFEADSTLPKLPVKTSYRYTIAGDRTVDVADENGTAVDPSALDEAQVLNNCSPADKERIENFVNVFIPKYVAFTANTDFAIYYNYNNLLENVVSDSDLQIRLRDAIPALGYVYSSSDYVQSIVINGQTAVGEGIYIVDVVYEIETLNYTGNYVVTTNYLKLALTDTDDGVLKAFAAHTYAK